VGFAPFLRTTGAAGMGHLPPGRIVYISLDALGVMIGQTHRGVKTFLELM
jgi:hypothetical protein